MSEKKTEEVEEAPLEVGDIRVLLLIPGSTAVVTMRAPEPDVSTTHTHGGRPS